MSPLASPGPHRATTVDSALPAAELIRQLVQTLQEEQR